MTSSNEASEAVIAIVQYDNDRAARPATISTLLCGSELSTYLSDCRCPRAVDYEPLYSYTACDVSLCARLRRGVLEPAVVCGPIGNVRLAYSAL